MSEGSRHFEQGEVFASRNGDRFWQPALVQHSRAGSSASSPSISAPANSTDARSHWRAEHPSPWTPEVDALFNLCVDDVRAGNPDGCFDLLDVLEDENPHPRLVPLDERPRREWVATEHHATRGAFEATVDRAARLEAVREASWRPQLPCTAARWSPATLLHG